MNSNPNEPLPGVFVSVVRRHLYKGPRIREGDYFPSTMEASQAIGFDIDVVGAALRRGEWGSGIGEVSGAFFVTAEYAAKYAVGGSWDRLYKAFPHLRERCGSKAE